MSGSSGGLSTVAALTSSVVFSVSLVICNKALLTNFGYNFGTTLTSWHLLFTFLALHTARMLGFFEYKPVDLRVIVGFGLLNGCSIGLLNLCLAFNSVGFYQMTKLAIIPCTVLLQTLFMNLTFSPATQISLLLLLLGVGIATVTDVEANALGSVLAFLALITTCVGQILTHTIQKHHDVSSTLLLYLSAPFQSIVLLVAGPLVDYSLTGLSVFYFDYNPLVVTFIVGSCLIAVGVNFSTFMVIGKTSPVTFQVLGHLKTCLILAFGYLILRNPFSWKNMAGILVALAGMFLYSFFQITEGRAKEKSNVSPLPVTKLQDGERDHVALLAKEQQEEN